MNQALVLFYFPYLFLVSWKFPEMDENNAAAADPIIVFHVRAVAHPTTVSTLRRKKILNVIGRICVRQSRLFGAFFPQKVGFWVNLLPRSRLLGDLFPPQSRLFSDFVPLKLSLIHI